MNLFNVIKKAMENCKNSNNNVSNHFIGTNKMISLAKNAVRNIQDYKLTRYTCYLIVLNCDSRKKVIALAKTYFAIQTRKQELSEKEYDELTEDEKRFYQRNLTRKGNYSLNIAAKNAGVKNFDIFHNYGYKGLRYKEDILDNMGSEELGANLFRITQTEAALREDNIIGENNADRTHYDIGKNIRETIRKYHRTMPENLPTPNKSLKELEKEKGKIAKQIN